MSEIKNCSCEKIFPGFGSEELRKTNPTCPVHGEAARAALMPPPTDEMPVLFYEREFYAFSNFSAFAVQYDGIVFPTSEHLYQWGKFKHLRLNSAVSRQIRLARSAHDALQIARANEHLIAPNWMEERVDWMRWVLSEKTRQHLYVRELLRETGKREIIENSPKDAFWGWGPKRDGLNMLGQLWMSIRSELPSEEPNNES